MDRKIMYKRILWVVIAIEIILLMAFFILYKNHSGKNNVIAQKVCYSDFGAVGDGVHDDFAAIAHAHTYANEHDLPVYAEEGATYYIGDHDGSIEIKTDTNWENAEFIIDDRNLTEDSKKTDVFTVTSEKNKVELEIPEDFTLSAGQENIGMALSSKSLLVIHNNSEKAFVRSGYNGIYSDLCEIILVDENGDVNENTPIMYDYISVDNIEAYDVGDERITITGGQITTIANQTGEYTYYRRGMKITRSNTIVSGVAHCIEEEGEIGDPYDGFFSCWYADNVRYENCKMSGHKTYYKNNEDGESISQGTYDIEAYYSNNVQWVNCTQINDIQDTAIWGVMATNFCKNLFVDACSFSRFDAHQGVYNVSITNCEIGQTINLVGSGTALIENTTRTSGYAFLNLRSDYGSTWDGTIKINNCVFEPDTEKGFIIYAEWNDWNYGYRCQMPQEIYIDGFKVKKERKNKKIYLFSETTKYDKKYIDDSDNPYSAPQKVILQDVDFDEISLCETDFYDQTELIYK